MRSFTCIAPTRLAHTNNAPSQMSIAPLPHPANPVAEEYRHFLDAARAAGFEGQICTDFANSAILSTDNSIYQRFPQAAAFPANANDVQILTRLLAEPAHRNLV